MALNFSHRPIFSEDNLVSPMRMGIPEKSGVENCFDYGRDRCDRGGGGASHDDIVDLLPSDPFGMDISTTFTALTGWLEDLEVDYGGYRRDELGASDDNYQLFAGLNFIWNNAMRFHAHVEKMDFGECSSVSDDGAGAASSNFEVGSASYANVSGFPATSGLDNVVRRGGGGSGSDELGGGGSRVDEFGPHPALSFSLGYLGLSDLLVVERVCKSLHSTVHDDPLLWRSIVVDQPLNERMTDDSLCQLVSRAQGNLQCLSLAECTRITDEGLRRVLESNPKLTKLIVPGCTRLSIEGIVGMLKVYNSVGTQGVKHLHIGGLYGVTQKHFEELRFLLGADGRQQMQHSRKPHFYRRGNLYLSCYDDRAMDIEVCPRCQNLRLVYDCPAESCQGMGHTTQMCRACTLCIPRCSQCGHCINDSEYEETFCLELLCSSCSKQLVKCSEGETGPAKSVIMHEQS